MGDRLWAALSVGAGLDLEVRGKERKEKKDQSHLELAAELLREEQLLSLAARKLSTRLLVAGKSTSNSECFVPPCRPPKILVKASGPLQGRTGGNIFICREKLDQRSVIHLSSALDQNHID